MEPGERLPRGPPAQSDRTVYQGGRGFGFRPNPGAQENQLPGRDSAAGAEDRLHEEAAHGGGADAGDVGEGGDVGHQGEHHRKVVPPAKSGPAPGHAQIHDHH